MTEQWHSLSILFEPGMEPFQRHDIEDELEAALGDLGETTGGGTAVDLSFSDISLEVTDVNAGIKIIREVLQRLEVPKTTKITQHCEPEPIEYKVYE